MEDQRSGIEDAERLSTEMFDGLAVAYELGNSDKAIEIMLQKGREYPGIYTTHANLVRSTYMLGDIVKALPKLTKLWRSIPMHTSAGNIPVPCRIPAVRNG